jgi:hypothetical protein
MKRLLLWAGLLICAGCFTAAPPDLVTPAAAPVAKTYPPVMPEQANETNGHDTARALEEEINRDYQEIILAPSPR